MVRLVRFGARPIPSPMSWGPVTVHDEQQEDHPGVAMTKPMPSQTDRSAPSGAMLADLLARVQWRPEHLAGQLNTLADLHGHPERVHPKTPYKWLRGAQPRRPWPGLTAALLSRHLPTPVTPADLGWDDGGEESVSATAGLELPWTGAGGLQAARTLVEADGMQRRMFLTLLGTTLTTPAHEWLIANAATDTARATGADLPEDVIDQLDLITASLRRMDDQLGGGTLQAMVGVHLRTVVDLLENRRYSDTAGRRLHATAAELLRLGGFLAFDTGQHALAQRYWVAALHTAHAAGDRGLAANILGFMSCQAKDLGQTREAVTLAETARAGYPATAPRVQAILDLRAAEAYAVAGDLTSTRRAVDAAFDRLTDIAPGHGEPGWAYWLDVTHAHGQAGYCHLRLGQWDTARSHLRSALAAQAGAVSREGALRQVLMATTYVRQTQPDLDQALDLAGRAVATLAGQVSSARVVGHVTRLSDHLQPYRRNPVVTAFTDQARHLSRTA